MATQRLNVTVSTLWWAETKAGTTLALLHKRTRNVESTWVTRQSLPATMWGISPGGSGSYRATQFWTMATSTPPWPCAAFVGHGNKSMQLGTTGICRVPLAATQKALSRQSVYHVWGQQISVPRPNLEI